MSHVAAVSWPETQQPETRLAIQSLRKTRFFNANHVDVFCCCAAAMREACRRIGVSAYRRASDPARIRSSHSLKALFSLTVFA
jgi:hypothetical protein